MKKVFGLTVLAFIYVVILAGPAYAYIDPGTGSIILQGLAAGFVSILVFWRGLHQKIKGLFAFSKK